MRIVGLDADVFSVDGSTHIAKLQNISWNLSREFIDVSGINELDGVYRLGGREVEVTATCRIHDDVAFFDAVTNGTEVYVVFSWANESATYTLSMYAYVGQERINFPGRNEAAAEEITLRPSRPATLTHSSS